MREADADQVRLSELPDDALLDLEHHAVDVRTRCWLAMLGTGNDELAAMFGALDVRVRLLQDEVARRCDAELDSLLD
jgi:hypothetical protein